MASDILRDETDNSATAFVTKGKTRLEPILDGIKATALKAGGVQGMALMAVHGSLMAYTSALLNYVAGIGADDDLPEPRDEIADSKPNNPVEQAQLAAHLNPAEKAQLAGPNPAPTQDPPKQIAVVPQPVVSAPTEQADLLL